MFNQVFIPKTTGITQKSEIIINPGTSDETNFAALVGLTTSQLNRIRQITTLQNPVTTGFYGHFDCGYCGQYFKTDCAWVGFDFRFHPDFQFMISFRLLDCKGIEKKLKTAKYPYFLQYYWGENAYWANVFLDKKILLENDQTVISDIERKLKKLGF